MFRTSTLLLCSSLLFACGSDLDVPLEESPQVASRTDELSVVRCSVQNTRPISYTSVPAPYRGSCATRSSGYTTFRAYNPTSNAIRIQLTSAWWTTQYVLAPHGSPGFYADWTREYFGFPVVIDLLSPGPVWVASY